MTTEIRLSIPHRPPFHGVALLVVGGLAARLDLSYEHLEDLQLALESVLDRVRANPVTITLRVNDDEIEMLVGPMSDGVRAELAAEGGEDVGLRRILDAVVDSAELVPGDEGDCLKMTKAVAKEDG